VAEEVGTPTDVSANIGNYLSGKPVNSRPTGRPQVTEEENECTPD